LTLEALHIHPLPNAPLPLKAAHEKSYNVSRMKAAFGLIALLLLFPPVVSAIEPTSPGIRGSVKGPVIPESNHSAQATQDLTLSFWYQSPTSSVGLVDAISGAVAWQPLEKFRSSGSPDTLFPCRFTFRCSIDNRIIKYCNVTTDNRASYRITIDPDGLVRVSVDGPGRQSVSFSAEGAKKRISVYGRIKGHEAWCGIDP